MILNEKQYKRYNYQYLLTRTAVASSRRSGRNQHGREDRTTREFWRSSEWYPQIWHRFYRSGNVGQLTYITALRDRVLRKTIFCYINLSSSTLCSYEHRMMIISLKKYRRNLTKTRIRSYRLFEEFGLSIFSRQTRRYELQDCVLSNEGFQLLLAYFPLSYSKLQLCHNRHL